MNDRIVYIREEERKYHESCYDNYKLFAEGSWLHKPVKTVMETLGYFDEYESLMILDLGCGVGRNSIPLAESLKSRKGEVVVVDLLQSALDKLATYSQEFGVSEWIKPVNQDIGDYIIHENQFDYIVAVSALEHVENVSKFNEVLANMNKGTNINGINCIIMNTNIKKVDVITGLELDPLMEINLDTDKANELLAMAYNGWKVISSTLNSLEFDIERNNRKIVLKGECVTYVVRRMI